MTPSSKRKLIILWNQNIFFVFFQQPSMVIQNGMAPMTIQTSMGPMIAPVNAQGAPLVMNSTHNLINGGAPTPVPVMGYPTQPLPPVPPATSMSNHQPPPQLIQNGFIRNASTDSFAYIPSATKGQDSPQLR